MKARPVVSRILEGQGAIRLLAALLGLLLFFPAAARADIGTITLEASTCNSLTVKAHISAGWEPSPHPNKATYRLYHVASGNSIAHLASSDSATIHAGYLKASWPYYVYIEARSRHAGGSGIPLYRKVGELTVVTPHCPPAYVPTSYVPVPGDVRLRHEATGKCLFGNPQDGGAVKTWSCWKDPHMAVVLEPAGGADVRIKLQSQGKCLFGNPTQGREVKNWSCWNDPNMVYEKVDLGNNRLRLRHKATGQCMYGGQGGNGDWVRNWPCWADPNMVWVIDPF